MPVGEFDSPDDRFNYESELKDDEDTITFGKYKGLTPREVFLRDPGYITWATKAFPQGWVGSEELIKRAAKLVPSQDVHVKATQHARFVSPVGKYSNQQALIAAFEETMLETFGEFPTPYWKTFK
jgi:uncharacterized protein (DUF3820 family)